MHKSWICIADSSSSGQFPLILCFPGTVSHHCFVTGRLHRTDWGALLGKWDFHEKQIWRVLVFSRRDNRVYSLNFVLSRHSVRGETLPINIIAIPLTEHPLFYKYIRSHHPCSEEFTICKAHKSRGREYHRHKEWRALVGLRTSLHAGRQTQAQIIPALTLLNNFYHLGNGVETEEYIQPRW